MSHALSSGSHWGSGGEIYHFSLGVGGQGLGAPLHLVWSLSLPPLPQTQATYIPPSVVGSLFLVMSLQDHLLLRASDLTPSVTVRRHPKRCNL